MRLFLFLTLLLTSCNPFVDVKYVDQADELCKKHSGLNYIRYDNASSFEVNCINKEVYLIKMDSV